MSRASNVHGLQTLDDSMQVYIGISMSPFVNFYKICTQLVIKQYPRGYFLGLIVDWLQISETSIEHSIIELK